ncbi:Pentatricopeptide repeat-containing protein 1, mitochondrial [Oryzias melastigma]|uniref:Pentatricopeptide repeat domain 1 n=1 Tax=Oryzias melastigma TaxID=30732 RepID=A0A3B3CMT4_ORYME|nr:pentatricopeptide repeat-containing protein 1, mitochondrial [Oryzias melastigma]KAF6736443.1 Pentatricopeptide repeat-containing protein 1, mitochondrial [Oryzias melastigma]
MFKSVASACVRHAGKLPVARSSMFSALKESPESVTLRSQTRWRLLTTPNARFVSLPTKTDSVDTTPVPPDREDFGSLSTEWSSRTSYKKSSPSLQDAVAMDDEEEDIHQHFRRPGRRNTPYWYFLQCKKRIKENKLQEALDLFSRNMLKEERLQPEEYNYSVLIGGCGRAGQLKRAFKLYNDMKKRGLVASDATYTALFNACAEAPSNEAGLQQALKLEQELRRKNYPLSTITYHALLKTHAVTNHLQACLHTLREMLQNGHAVTSETFHYLLMGCLKDKETGFRLALQVWRQMLLSGILPDSKNYNLLLRTARDCGIGDPALAASILLHTDFGGQKGRGDVSGARGKGVVDVDLLERQLLLQSHPGGQRDSRPGHKDHPTSLIPVRQTENISLPDDLIADSSAPNLLELFEGKRAAVISLGSVDGASDRLDLIGGAKGFLEKMVASGLSPDLKTLTLLADMMEPGEQCLQVLLKVAKEHRVKLDAAFFNSVIRSAAKVGNLEEAKGVLCVMRQRNVSVNVQTFGCLALGCNRQDDGLQLLQDMKLAGLRPNVHVFSALIGRAARRLDYVYLKTLLKTMKESSVFPNKVIIRQLEFAAQYPPNYNQYKSRNNYLVHIDGFRGYYQQWLRDCPAQSDEEYQKIQTEVEDSAPNTESKDGLRRI